MSLYTHFMVYTLDVSTFVLFMCVYFFSSYFSLLFDWVGVHNFIENTPCGDNNKQQQQQN